MALTSNAAAAILAATTEIILELTDLPLLNSDVTHDTSFPVSRDFSCNVACAGISGMLKALEGTMDTYELGISCVPAAEKLPLGTLCHCQLCII